MKRSIGMVVAALLLLLVTAARVLAVPVNDPAGSTLDAKLVAEVSSKTARDGDRFTMVTASGSTIYGHLSGVVRASPTRKASLRFNFDLIQFPDGRRAPLHAALSGIAMKHPVNYGQAAAQALGGMVVGNIVGKKLGTNAGGLVGLAGGAVLAVNTAYDLDIPAGAPARISLTQPLVSER